MLTLLWWRGSGGGGGEDNFLLLDSSGTLMKVSSGVFILDITLLQHNTPVIYDTKHATPRQHLASEPSLNVHTPPPSQWSYSHYSVLTSHSHYVTLNHSPFIFFLILKAFVQ